MSTYKYMKVDWIYFFIVNDSKVVNVSDDTVHHMFQQYKVVKYVVSHFQLKNIEEIWWSTALIFAGWSIMWYSIQHNLDSKTANLDVLGGVNFIVLHQISSM